MEWKKRRKATVSVLLILVLLIVNSVSYIMADEYTIQTSELSEETESTELTEETESVDQSIVLANSVSGVLWLDENNDGILDEEEEPITDYPVYLYSEGDLSAEVQKVVTDQEGKYEFSELESGEYIVGVKAGENETEYILPTVEVTDDTTNKFTIDAEQLTAAFSEVIVIAEDSVLTDISCAMGQTVEQNAEQIENEDADTNNIVNDDSDGTSDTNDTNDETEQTDSAEDNELQNEDSEEEWETDSEQKRDYSISPSDLETNTDTTESTDTTDTNSISGMLWLDENTDGIYDAGEQPVSDYPVYLYKSDNTSTAIKTVTTDTHGKYKFANLEPGDYKVGIKMQENGTSYLLPLSGISDDNKFVIDWVSLEAFTEIITLEVDGLADINGGLRSTPEVSPTNITDGYRVYSGTTYSGTSYLQQCSTLYDACAYINSLADGTYTIAVTDDDADVGAAGGTIDTGKFVYLRSDSTTTRTLIKDKDSTLSDEKNRHISVYGTLYLQYITLDGNGVCGGIQVNSGGNATLAEGSIIQNCFYSGSSILGGGGGIQVKSGGILNMSTGATIQNCSVGTSGGGVYVAGTFNMNGGNIEGNAAVSTSYGGGVSVATGAIFNMGNGTNECYISNNSAPGGGGVSCGGTFNMNTTYCYIRGNEATSNYGGGVYISSGTFNMKAGVIGESGYQNTARWYGGGVYVGTNGTCNMGGIGKCYIQYNKGLLGGGVAVDGSGAEFNMTTTSCYIRSNSTGGVYMRLGSVFNMEAGYIGEEGYPNSGSTSYAGGVYMYGSGTFNMGGTDDCYIQYNTATSGGGGVQLNGSNCVFNMTTTSCYIRSNKGSMKAGGVLLESGTFNMEAGSIGESGYANTATGGPGAGVYASGGTFTMGGKGDCYIQYNTTGSSGGGVYITGDDTLFEMTTSLCYIKSNSANSGGGVYLNNGTFNMQAGYIGYSGYANTANYGGGVYVSSSGNFTMGGSSICNISFNESIYYGGGVACFGTFTMGSGSYSYIDNNTTATHGGGVYVSGSSAVFNMSTTSTTYSYIRNNEAKSDGGGVYLNSGEFNMVAGYIGAGSSIANFGNKAANGGGIYANGGTFTMGGAGTCIVAYNTASDDGGGVYVSGSSTKFEMTTSASYVRLNKATSNGGGVYLNSGEFNMQCGYIGYTSINYKNTAVNGGGVYAAGGTFNMGGDTNDSFIRCNTAEENGGGVFINKAKFNMTTAKSYITNNTATAGDGGGMYIAASSGSLTTSGGSITNNSATSGNGGGIYTADTPNYSNIKTDLSTVFSDNTAKSFCNTPTHALTDFPDIGFSSVSLTSAEIDPLHPLNNYDINCETVKLTYDPNATDGGQGTAYDEYYVKSTSAAVLDNTDAKLGFTNSDSKYYFDDWNSATDGNGTIYTAGDSITLAADMTIYAQWRVGVSSIEITKTVTGKIGNTNKEFEITITLKDDNGTLVTGTSYAYTGSAISGVTSPGDSSMTFTDGKGTIKLKHGQTITLSGIPKGYTYTVEETDSAVTGGTYTVAYSGTGTLSSERDSISETLSGNATVSITNNRDSVPVSGLNGMDYRLAAAGLLAILAAIITMLWFCRRRSKCK